MLIYPVYNLRRKIAVGLILSALVFVGSWGDYFLFIPSFLRSFLADYRVLTLLTAPAAFWCGTSLYLGSLAGVRKKVLSGELPLALAVFLSWSAGAAYGFKPSWFFAGAVEFKPDFLFTALAPTVYLILVYIEQVISRQAGMSLREPTSSIKLAVVKSSELTAYVIVLAGLSFLAWNSFFRAGFDLAFRVGLAVLATGAPLSLVLSAPLVAARLLKTVLSRGVKLRRAQTLESLERVRVAVFSKRGVVTVGNPKVEEVLAPRPKELLSLAIALCQADSHPLARALADYCQDRGLPVKFAGETEHFSGKGLAGVVEGKRVALGNMALMKQEGVVVGVLQREKHRLEEQGKTVLIVGVAHKSDRFNPKPGELLGMIVFRDSVRSGFSKVVSGLERLGVESWMQTGDSLKTAQAVGAKVGIGKERILSEAVPDDKENGLLDIARRAKISEKRLLYVGLEQPKNRSRNYIFSSFQDSRADIFLSEPDFIELVSMLELARGGIGKINRSHKLATAYHLVALPLAAGALNFGNLKFVLSPLSALALGGLFSVALMITSQWRNKNTS